MTIRLVVSVDPVDETAQISVTEERKDDKGDYQTVAQQVLVAAAPISSTPLELQIGDKVTISLEASGKIVMDQDQNAARIEPIAPPPEIDQGPGHPGPKPIEEEAPKARTASSGHSRR